MRTSYCPAKYLFSAFTNSELSVVACANRVIEDRNFTASVIPRICFADLFWILQTSSVQCRKRGPKMGWSRYCDASSRDPMANFIEVALVLRPLICGNMNHVQGVSLRPSSSSQKPASMRGTELLQTDSSDCSSVHPRVIHKIS